MEILRNPHYELLANIEGPNKWLFFGVSTRKIERKRRKEREKRKEEEREKIRKKEERGKKKEEKKEENLEL